MALLILAVTGIVTGSTEYAITASNGIDTPNTEVTLEGSTFTVRGLATVAEGDTISASVTLPAEMDSRVYVYGTIDGERVIIDSKFLEAGTTTVEFDTDGLDPGTYTLALHADGDYRAVYPFIVTGARIDNSIPNSATVGESLSLTADVTPTDSVVDVTGVEFVIYGNGVTKRIDAAASDSGYSATLETSNLPAGEYTIYAAVQNASKAPMGEPELVAVSPQQTLTLESASDSQSGSQQTSTTTTTQTTTTSTTTTTTSVPATTTTNPPTTSVTTTSQTTTTPHTTSSTGSAATTANVITPNSETTTSTSAPGLSLGASILALLGALLVREST